MGVKLGCLCVMLITCSLSAEEMLQHLANVRILQENTLPQDTSYRHHDQIVRWKGENGAIKYECHADCSGLIDALLNYSYGISKTALEILLQTRHRPLARNYYEAFIGQRGFRRIDQIAAIQPGDFIAIKYLPWAGDKGHDTGHILVVNGAPKEIAQFHANGVMTRRFAIEIIDCSSGHGKEDSRYRNGRYHPGIGKGTFSVFTNERGVITGYSWSPTKDSKYYGADKRPLAIGRLLEKG